MNPFNKRMSDHSTCPVLLTMYNIPTWLCQKRKYLLLTILISGPKQPGIDIDVFLKTLTCRIYRSLLKLEKDDVDIRDISLDKTE